MAGSSVNTVAVTGATGFVGRYAVRELLARGLQVRALIRTAAKAREALGSPLPAGVELVMGDACDGRVLADLVKGAQACIHLIGIIREQRTDGSPPQTFDRMHVQATRAILAACADAGVTRYAHMSALGVGPEGKSDYQKTKWEAEQLVRRSGLDWTIFRPSIIHGPEGEFILTMANLCSGEMFPYYFMPYIARPRINDSVPMGPVEYESASIQPVSVEDVAFCFAEALKRSETVGEVYNLAGPEVLTWPELMEFIRDTLPGMSRGLSTWYMPGPHAVAIATAAGKLGVGSLLPFDRGQALMAMEDMTADVDKARADLGLEPKPFRATVQGYAGRV